MIIQKQQLALLQWVKKNINGIVKYYPIILRGKNIMYIQPNTVIRILQEIPLDSNYQNTIYFDNVNAQINYFSSKTKFSLDDSTYQRVNIGEIRCNQNAEKLYNCNYIMFQNKSFGSKWFYGFIKSVEYVNDEMSLISFDIDELQTWLFDYELQYSFVERETVEDDTIGKHTIDESLDYGEYQIADENNVTEIIETGALVAYTKRSYTGGLLPNNFNNIFNGMSYIFYPKGSYGSLSELIEENYKDIAYICNVPFSLIADPTTSDPTQPIILGDNFLQRNITKIFNTEINNIMGYVPKNNKLFCYPYCLLHLTNNCGSSADFKREFFKNINKIEFAITGVLSSETTLNMFPLEYKNNLVAYEYGLTLSNYVLSPYISDTYATWWATNRQAYTTNVLSGSVSSALTVAGAGIGIATGLVNPVTGAIAGTMATANFMNKTINSMASKKDTLSQPNQASGSSTNGNVNLFNNKQTFTMYTLQIKKEYAEIIDNFFSMYGYKINEVKIPNINKRPHWNYTKTNGVNIKNINVPNDSVEIIKNCFNNGITFWKNPLEVGNYSLDNSI